MSFLYPWAWWLGLAALGLPVAIHWLTRPRPRKVPWPALRLLREVVRDRRRPHRLRHVFVLSLRMLAIALLAGAFARPLWGHGSRAVPPATAASTQAPGRRVVLWDVSQSLAAHDHGIQPMERARAAVEELISSTPATWRCDLILAAQSPQVITADHAAARAALWTAVHDAAALPEALDAQAALAAAAALLRTEGAGSVGGPGEWVIVSDFQRTSWPAVQGHTAPDWSVLPADVAVRLLPVGADHALPNRAIVQVTFPPAAIIHQPLTVQAEIADFTTNDAEPPGLSDVEGFRAGLSATLTRQHAPPRPVTLRFTLGDEHHDLTTDLAAGARKVVSATFNLVPIGWQRGTVQLLDHHDALAADDWRAFVVLGRGPRQFVLITSESDTSQPTSSYFVARALAPWPGDAGPATVQRLTPAQLDAAALASADLIIVDHPGPLGDVALAFLRDRLHQGRSLLYIAAEPADADNLNQLANQLAAPWPSTQPATAPMPWPIHWSAAPRERHGQFITQVRHEPPFTIFGEDLEATLAAWRIEGGLTATMDSPSGGLNVLATCADGVPFLVVGECGGGTLAVLNADLSRSTLAATPGLVPLLGELVERLQVVSPPPADMVPPSVAPPSESDLTPLDPATLALHTPTSRSFTIQDTSFSESVAVNGEAQSTDTAWRWWLLACLACMLLELSLLRRHHT